MIVATAGHVDHGKTALVRALTGQDTDRLPEEKRRGMSIDLGFAYLARPDGSSVALVDVPGHERFVHNMAAGVQGIDLALLVVAADDGPMPQTLEHLAILRSLQVPRILGVVTKVDRVEPARVDAVALELQALLRHSDIVRASSVTGEGVPGLRSFLLNQVSRPRARSGGRFRMNVDRAFVLEGVGLVVTGSVLGGVVAVGDAVSILPAGRSARVRSLRVNSGAAHEAGAGERCALALHGVARGEVERGHVVVAGPGGSASRELDVRLDRLPARRAQVLVHLGTAHSVAQLAPLGEGFARLRFAAPLCAWHGDRLLVRDPGTRALVAGGEVVDAVPPSRGATRPQHLERLRAIAGVDAAAALDTLLAGEVDLDWIARNWNLTEEEARRLAESRPLGFYAARGARHAVRASFLDDLKERIETRLAEAHAAHPDWLGLRPAELRAALVPRPSSELLAAAIDALSRDQRLVRDGPWVRLPGHRPVLAPGDERLWQRIRSLLDTGEARPPRVHELAEALTMEPKAIADFLGRAARAGLAEPVASNRFFLPHAVERLAALAQRLDAESGGEGFSAARYRDASGLGRNLTIEVLEYLDAAGHTVRRGELRRSTRTTEEKRTPVGRPDFKSGERRDASLVGSTPASSATPSP